MLDVNKDKMVDIIEFHYPLECQRSQTDHWIYNYVKLSKLLIVILSEFKFKYSNFEKWHMLRIQTMLGD